MPKANIAAATTAQVVSSPAPKVHSKALGIIEEYRAKIEEQIDGVKIDLAKKLEEARQLYVVLSELGHKDALKEPMFFEVVTAFKMQTHEVVTAKTRSPMAPGGGKRGRSSDTKPKILEYATKKEEVVTIPELAEKLQLAGLTVRNNVKSLVTEGKMKDTGKDGKTILYSIVK